MEEKKGKKPGEIKGGKREKKAGEREEESRKRGEKEGKKEGERKWSLPWIESARPGFKKEWLSMGSKTIRNGKIGCGGQH